MRSPLGAQLGGTARPPTPGWGSSTWSGDTWGLTFLYMLDPSPFVEFGIWPQNCRIYRYSLLVILFIQKSSKSFQRVCATHGNLENQGFSWLFLASIQEIAPELETFRTQIRKFWFWRNVKSFLSLLIRREQSLLGLCIARLEMQTNS